MPTSLMTMLQTVRRLNIEHYRRVLVQTDDEAKRQHVLKLLAEEEAKTESNAPNRTIPPAT